MALSEFLEHDIFGVEFGWNNNTRRSGVVKYIKNDCGDWEARQMFLSLFALENAADKFELVDTFYHELAHIIALHRYGNDAIGHGWQWKECCRELGIEPRVRKNLGISPEKYKYTAYCPEPNCNLIRGFSKLGKVWRRTMLGYASNSYYCADCNCRLKVRQNF